MSHLTPGDRERILAYVSGAVPPDDAQDTERWIAQAEERQDCAMALQRTHASLRDAQSAHFDVDTLVDDVRRAITVQDGRRLSTRPPLGVHASHRAVSRRRLAYGLGAAVACGAALVALAHGTLRTSAETLARTTHTYATTVGQVASIPLPDGSHVILAPQSHLAVRYDRASGARYVTLTGEAYFDVHASAHAPFVVTTANVTTRVLGTAFDVRRYAGDAATVVSVVNGRVATGGYATPVVLAAGATARVSDSTAVVNSMSNPAQATSWSQGNLVFNEAPLPAVLATLSRWYGYDFRLADTVLASKVISAEFRTDQVAETMRTLKAVLGATMTFDGKIVTLRLTRTADVNSRNTIHRDFLRHAESEVGK